MKTSPGQTAPGTGFGSAPIEIGPGTELGSYKLVSLLGAGAMGKVWRAEHVRLGRAVAIKVLNPEYVARPDVVQRFFREARVVNDIDHEHIVEVTDFVEAPGLAYLVMELLDGTSLRDLMKQRGRKYPPLARIVGLMAQVCEALEAAHEKGVVHRDLKPDNVFVVKRGGEDFVKVLDFGVAKLHDAEQVSATHTGMVLGTPLYMAPEQATGQDVDARADVYAAGVVLYELLAGAVPFTGATFVELVAKIRQETPKPLPAKTPRGDRIPPALAAAVMRCLEKRPADRFRSMAALAEALREPHGAQRPARSRRFLPRAVVAALLAAATLFVIARGYPARVISAIASSQKSGRELSSRIAPPVATPSPPRAAPSTPEPESTATSTRTPTSTPTRNSTTTSTSTSTHAAAPSSRTSSSHHAASVELTLRSTPSGATVTRLDTKERLGKTPLRVKVPRKVATVWLQMSLDGHSPRRFAVDLRKDNTANVALPRSKKAARRR